jgi:hypothetical protein
MAFVVADRVQETSTTAGTGTLNLAGAVAGNRTFVSGIGTGNTTYYVIYDQTAQVWEIGLGTVLAGTPNTLSRDTVYTNSSGTTVPINLAGNSAYVWCDYPATQSVYKNPLGEATAPAMVSSNGITVNAQAVSQNYTIATGNNGFSAGPVSVNSGVTVTIADGSLWVVL